MADPKIHFEITPKGEGYAVTGYVDKEKVIEVSKDEWSKADAEKFARVWQSNTEKNLCDLSHKLEKAASDMPIETHRREEKIL